VGLRLLARSPLAPDPARHRPRLGSAYPPLPAYVLAGGAIVLLYLALRIALVSFATRRLNREQEEEIRKLEHGRVLYELHDTVK
jgi:hypothetical protein